MSKSLIQTIRETVPTSARQSWFTRLDLRRRGEVLAVRAALQDGTLPVAKRQAAAAIIRELGLKASVSVVAHWLAEKETTKHE